MLKAYEAFIAHVKLIPCNLLNIIFFNPNSHNAGVKSKSEELLDYTVVPLMF